MIITDTICTNTTTTTTAVISIFSNPFKPVKKDFVPIILFHAQAIEFVHLNGMKRVCKAMKQLESVSRSTVGMARMCIVMNDVSLDKFCLYYHSWAWLMNLASYAYLFRKFVCRRCSEVNVSVDIGVA